MQLQLLVVVDVDKTVSLTQLCFCCLFLCACVLLDHQTTVSSSYGIYVMTPVEQITRHLLIAVSNARQYKYDVGATLLLILLAAVSVLLLNVLWTLLRNRHLARAQWLYLEAPC
jgi:hypothetical protein